MTGSAFWAYLVVVEGMRNRKRMLWKGVLLGSVRKGSREAPCVRFWETETARTFLAQTINFHRVTAGLRPVHEANGTFFYKTTGLCQSRGGACALPGWRGPCRAALPLCYGCPACPRANRSAPWLLVKGLGGKSLGFSFLGKPD